MLKISKGNILGFLRRFFKRMNAPYRVVIVNEETLQEAMTLHLTKRSVYFFISTSFIVLFLLLGGLILYTPLRYYLPGFQKNVTRIQLLKMKQVSDSLIALNASREQYIFNLVQIANGNISTTLDTVGMSAKEIEQAEKQNINRIDRASNYEYLKNQKIDSSKIEDKMGKDTSTKK